MKKTLHRIISTVLAISLVMGLGFILPVSAEGMTFQKDRIYTVSSSYESAPLTIEAVVSVPQGIGRTQTIIGSDDGDAAKDHMTFQINSKGNPVLAIYGPKTATTQQNYGYTFANTDVRTGKPMRLTVVRDTVNMKLYLYIGGTLADTVADTSLFENRAVKFGYEITSPFCVGSDYRDNGNGEVNAYYFGGTIYSLAVYSDMRTADEIKASQTDFTDTALMAAYDFTTGAGIFKDRTAAHKADNAKVYDITDSTGASVSGITFTKSEEPDTVSKLLEDFPATLEVTFTMPATVTDTQRGGIIFSTYDGTSANHFYNLFIDKAGVPWLQLGVANGSAYALKFTDIDVRTGEPIRLTVTYNSETGVANAYVNGVYVQTAQLSANVLTAIKNSSYAISTPFMVGGDKRTVSDTYNAYTFKGTIYSLAAYSDVRTASEIAAQQTVLTDENIILAYDFTDPANTDTDITGNGYDIGEYVEEEILPTEGLTFTTEPYYILENTLTDIPHTYSVSFYIPKSLDITSASTGSLLGSWYDNIRPSILLDIQPGGNPRFYYRVGETSVNYKSITYTGGTVEKGKWQNLTFVVEENNLTVTCYLNGSSIGTGTLKNTYDEHAITNKFLLGGTQKPGNSDYFKGIIKEAVLYTESLGASDVSALYSNGTNSVTAEPLVHYDLTNAVDFADIPDLSGNGNDIICVNRWFTEKEPVTGYDYSFAVIGDTQKVTYNDPDKLSLIYDWIADNAASKNIKYAFGLGDIVETASGLDSEWTVAKNAIALLEGVVPYSLIRGNHDNTAKFNSYFGTAEYKASLDGFYSDDDISNFYDLFEVGDDKYLLVGLDYGPSDDVLAWAGEIIESHPERKVIITTHAMLGSDGEWFTDSAENGGLQGGGLNNGPAIWDKLVKKYANIYLVLCGHDPSDNIIVKQAKGENGNTVTTMLIDPQDVDRWWGSTGLVAMFYVYSEENKIAVEYYSPIREAYFIKENQFTLSLASETDDEPDEPTAPSVSIAVTEAPESATVGSTFTVNIDAVSVDETADELASVNFTIDYDKTKLELVSVESKIEGGEYAYNPDTAAYGWHYAATAPLTVTADGTTMVSATFKVKDDATFGDKTVIDIDSEALLHMSLVDDTYKKGFVPTTVSSDDIVFCDFDFIYDYEYLALETGTAILLIKGDNNCVYSIDGTAMYYSEKYGAHVAIVSDDAGERPAELAARITVADGTAETVNYGGDVNGDGFVGASDAAIVSEMLHAYGSEHVIEGVTDIMRLRADVCDTDGTYVTVTDCQWILYASVGLTLEATAAN